jgi:hypothetical protein
VLRQKPKNRIEFSEFTKYRKLRGVDFFWLEESTREEKSGTRKSVPKLELGFRFGTALNLIYVYAPETANAGGRGKRLP